MALPGRGRDVHALRSWRTSWRTVLRDWRANGRRRHAGLGRLRGGLPRLEVLLEAKVVDDFGLGRLRHPFGSAEVLAGVEEDGLVRQLAALDDVRREVVVDLVWEEQFVPNTGSKVSRERLRTS
jgi:hypothetical protein